MWLREDDHEMQLWENASGENGFLKFWGQVHNLVRKREYSHTGIELDDSIEWNRWCCQWLSRRNKIVQKMKIKDENGREVGHRA